MRLDDPKATLLNQASTFGPGTVAIIAGDLARYTAFWLHAFNVMYALPEGTAIMPTIGSDISESRNQAIRALQGEWVWFIDDDHTFPHEIVMKLLARDVDIVAPLVLRRQSPFWPVATVDGNYLDVSRYRPGDLVEAQFTGSSGMLIRKKVLDAIEPPWFPAPDYDEQGRRRSEDVNFCLKAAEAGFSIHVDTGIRMGHITTATVLPVWDDDHEEWMTGISVADGYEVRTEVVSPPPEVAASAQ